MENLIKEKWDEKDYQEYIEYLFSIKDDKYKKFHSKLTTTKYDILGVKVPLMRQIAKYISKGDIDSFLKYSKNNYYEEVMIKGFIIANIKDKEELLFYLDDYISLIDNWAICDGFCNSLKIVKKDLDFWFLYFKKYLSKKNEFEIRTSLVIFLNFYVDKKYLEEIFTLIDKITIDKYYVNMATSWFLCECFIKYPDYTLKYLLKSKINTFTFNKTISKIKDSYRVSLEDKIYLETLRRRS